MSYRAWRWVGRIFKLGFYLTIAFSIWFNFHQHKLLEKALLLANERGRVIQLCKKAMIKKKKQLDKKIDRFEIARK